MNPLQSPDEIQESESFQKSIDYMKAKKLLRIVTDDKEVIGLLNKCNLPTQLRHTTMDSRKCLMFASTEDKCYVFCLWFGYEDETDNGYSALEFDKEFMKSATESKVKEFGMMLIFSGLLGFHIEDMISGGNWTQIPKNWSNNN